MDTTSIFLNTKGSARELCCSESQVKRMLADGRLPSVQIGRMRRIPRAAIEAMAAAVVAGEQHGGPA